VIGGAAGAFPPMIGWAAVTGDVSAVGIALFLLIFLWTRRTSGRWRSTAATTIAAPACHAAGGRGPRETKRQMLIYTLVLLPVALAPTVLGTVGWLYGGGALMLSLAFIRQAIAVWRRRRPKWPSAGAAHVPLLAALPRRSVRGPAARPDAGRMSDAMSSPAPAIATGTANSAARTWSSRPSWWRWW